MPEVCPWWQVGQRHDAWKQVATGEALAIVTSGATLTFTDGTEPPPHRAAERPVPPKHRALVASELQRQVEIGLARRVPPGTNTHNHPASAIVKQRPDGSVKCRVLFDGRYINGFLPRRRFRQEGWKELKALVRPGDLLGKADVKDAFVHVRMNETASRYLGFSLLGQEFVCTAAPFGLAHSPILWHKLMTVVISEIRAAGVRVVLYVDDMLWCAETQPEYARSRDVVVRTCARFGIMLAPDKLSGPLGTTTETFLGLQVTTTPRPFISVPPDKLQAVRDGARAIADRWRAGSRRVFACQLKSLLGTIQYLDTAVPFTRLRTRELHCCVGSLFGWRKVELTDQAIADLDWWSALSLERAQKPTVPAPLTAPLEVFTDSSLIGWGAVLDGVETGGDWPLRLRNGDHSINVLELRAVLMALRCFRAKLTGRHILLRSDNSTVVACLASGTSRHRHIMDQVRPILALVDELGATLRPMYVPTADNTADAPSRDRRFSALDWRLDPAEFARLERRWHVNHTLDAFASHNAHLVARYASRLPDPGCAFVDAFSRPWAGEHVFANPPFALVGRALVHARSTCRPGDTLTILVPRFTAQWWWPLLLELRPRFRVVPKAAILPPPTWATRRAEPRCNWAWRLLACRILF